MTKMDERLNARAHSRLVAACRIYRARLDRAHFFRFSLFGEGGWDALLALYVFAAAGRRLNARELCAATCSTTSSGLRLQRRLVDLDLIHRTGDASDRRALLIQLTPQGVDTLERYLDYLIDNGMAPVGRDQDLDSAAAVLSALPKDLLPVV